MTDKGSIPIGPNHAAAAESSLVAPTPQNTPLNTAPITSGLSRPTVPDIPEGDDEDEAKEALKGAMLGMVQDRLNTLIGRSSGYIESLPKTVRLRVEGLKGVQTEYKKAQAEYAKELIELDRKYLALYQPIFNRRAAILNGEAEPTTEEIKAGEEESLKDNPDAEPVSETEESEEDAAKAKNMKGIPEFWLTALRNHMEIGAMIEDRDEDALKSLKDIRVEMLEKGKVGFRLIFHFAPNEYFTNEVLTKTYNYLDELNYEGGNTFSHAEGCKIEWKDDKDLTQTVEVRKQRNKNTNRIRIVKKAKATPSFFDFFSPPTPPDEDAVENGDMEPDEFDELEEKVDLDAQIGEDIRDRIIPRAIDWFTGKALEYELDGADEDEGSDDGFDEEDENDDDDEDDDEELPAPRRRPQKNTALNDQGECKNQ
ncbi:hypothetical protein FRC03_009937 [Tulasnella sp. 419]|nr:hypothetical protein FRC03_009937 [Tulasnella sp. 419]